MSHERSTEETVAPIDLAHAKDFSIGAMRFRPALREVEHSGHVQRVEPRVMQVLLALAEARGEVLSRDDLQARCWNGTTVGEDALNRVIMKVRRLSAPDQACFEIETIPRVGYRLKEAQPIESGQMSRSEGEGSESPPATQDTRAGRSPLASTVKSSVPLLLAAILLAAAIAIGAFAARQGGVGETTVVKTPEELAGARIDEARSVDGYVRLAVIPFTAMSPDPDDQHFADGLSEELLNWLANVEGLKVPARTTSFDIRDKSGDLRDIGERLGVDYVLEGSVRKSQTSLRIAAQLIDVRTGYHLWSKVYEKERSDIFAIQDEIARLVVTELLGKIPESGAVNPAAVGEVDPKAHELYLEGRSLLTQREWEEAFPKFQAAVAVDARHFLAQAYIAVIAAWAQANAVPLPGPPKNLAATADAALAAAVGLNPKSADVLFAQGWVADARIGRFNGPTSPVAVDFYQRAVRANPRHVEALHALARAEMMIDPERSVEHYEQVLEIDPTHSAARANLIDAYLATGRRESALVAARQSLTLGLSASRKPAAIAGWKLGDMALVGEAIFGDWEATERDVVMRWWRAAVLAELGAIEEARFLFEKVAVSELPMWREVARINIAVLDQDAKTALNAALEIRNLESAPPFFTSVLGAALIRVGEPSRAYDVLLARWPKLAEQRIKGAPLNDLRDIDCVTAAHALQLAGRIDEARTLWQAALASAESDQVFPWRQHLELALVQGNLGDRSSAIKNFKAAFDAGFRYLWFYDGPERVNDGFYAEHGVFKPLLAIPEIAAIVEQIEAENAATLEQFNQQYKILDRVHEMMAAETAARLD